MSDITEKKKTPQEIKEKILETLDRQQKPLSVQDISKEIGSNWLTIKDYIKDLQKENKVREIVLGEKVRIFKLIRDDTYLDIPITRKEKELFYFLFHNAKKIFRVNGEENPTKIKIQKSIVNVIDKFNLQLPTAWYLYGKMTLIKYEPDKDYSTYSIKLENEKEVLDYMKKIILENIKLHWTKVICKNQYFNYDQSLYQKKEEIIEILADNLNERKVELRKKLVEMYFAFPSDNESLLINSLLHDFELLIGKMIHFDLNEHKKTILETFDAVWKMIAIHLFFVSLSKYPRFANMEEFKSIYLKESINNKISNAKEMITDLEIEYRNCLSKLKEPPKLPEDEKSKMLSEMVGDMAKEGVNEDG